MNQFLADPSTLTAAFYYATCLLNFIAALWLSTSIVRMREIDPWLLRFAVTLVGMVHAIITISMFKNPEYAHQATSLVWWWMLTILGLLVILEMAGLKLGSVLRAGGYVGTGLAAWGAYMVFTEQNAFNELATYYGFFGANLAAASWMILDSVRNPDLIQKKRLINFGVGAIYAAAVVTGLQTMQMILESPY